MFNSLTLNSFYHYFLVSLHVNTLRWSGYLLAVEIIQLAVGIGRAVGEAVTLDYYVEDACGLLGEGEATGGGTHRRDGSCGGGYFEICLARCGGKLRTVAAYNITV